jgi:hypothetical protein
LLERTKKWLKRRNSLSITSILILLILNIPRIFEDIAQLKLIFTGDPWVNVTEAANIAPNFSIWEIAVFGIDLFFIFFIVWNVQRNQNRYSQE